MRVHLTSAYPYDAQVNFGGEWLVRHASPDAGIVVTDDPDAADVVLFVENHPEFDPYFRAMHAHPVFRRHRERCVLYHDQDLTVTTVPTLSPSIERWQYDARFHRSVHYIARLCPNEQLDAAEPRPLDRPAYLYSFLGSAETNPVRRELLRLKDPRALLEDTSGRNAWEMARSNRESFQNRFLDVTFGSAFILCPRGVGPCTYRLFESLQAGRAPVIIADEWVPPDGADWTSFAVFVKESQVHRIPHLLRELEPQAAAMGARARVAWETYFSPAVSLGTLVDAAAKVTRVRISFADRLRLAAQIRNPPRARILARHVRNRLRDAIGPRRAD